VIVPHPWQEDALAAFDSLDGLFLGQPPGSGKTWVIAQCLSRGQRPLLACPAAARTQTRKMFDSYGVRSGFVSYSQISRDPDLLERYKPDVIGLDEGHALRRTRDSAWGRRISRYLAANPSCRVVASTGSAMHRDMADYAHLLDWALRSRSPAPRSQAGIERAAREAAANPEAWLATLRACPGVYIDAAPSWDGELVIREHVLPVSDDSAYARAAATGLAPDGWACEGFALDELLRQLSWGYYIGRSPRPSPELVDLRRTWAKCVAEAKAYGLCDTEMGAREHYPAAWAAYSAAFTAEKCEPVTVWVGPPGTEHVHWGGVPVKAGTIVWVNHPVLAERVTKLCAWPYHHEKGLDERGVSLDQTTAPVVVASIKACHASFNAQGNFCHNIVLEPPSDARVWQQLICRTARQGQKSPCVSVDVVVSSPTAAADLATARKLAAEIERQTGQAQALLTPTQKEKQT